MPGQCRVPRTTQLSAHVTAKAPAMARILCAASQTAKLRTNCLLIPVRYKIVHERNGRSSVGLKDATEPRSDILDWCQEAVGERVGQIVTDLRERRGRLAFRVKRRI